MIVNNYKHIFLLILSLGLSSCSKDPEFVHIHGRVTMACDSSVPVPNIEVQFQRIYDTGRQHGDYLGDAKTDKDGYFSFKTKVYPKGTFNYYQLNIYPENNIDERQYSAHVTSSDGSNDVEMNATADISKVYGFHIKNMSPVDSNDKFNSLISFYNNISYFEHSILSNLTGTKVDTVVYRYFLYRGVNCEYSYTKSGVLTIVPINSLENNSCLDTTIIDVFY